MYITKVKLSNIRCFENLSLDLSSPSGARMWSVILGDNGVGKTSLIRSIAMGLCDDTTASGLLQELWGNFVRDGEKAGSIYIEFETESGNGKSPWIKTTIESGNSGTRKVKQKTYPEKFSWDEIFVCGYGSARRPLGTKSYDEYAQDDAVYTLFNYEASLKNPELIMRRLQALDVDIKGILQWIDSILMLPSGSTKLSPKEGITIKGGWGSFVPVGAVSDGYAATLGWIVDLLGWALLYDETMFTKELSGIVLLDEIEQHLHPKWQSRIVALLHRQFPKIQFITTTHSPLCAASTVDLDEGTYQLFHLNHGEDGSVVAEEILLQRGLRADQVLTSTAFDMSFARSGYFADILERYRDLYIKSLKNSLNKKERKELEEARQIIAILPEHGETEEERKQEMGLRKMLDEINAKLKELESKSD